MSNCSEQINELAAALAAAQGEMAHASKDQTNPAFGKKYADLASVVDACREPLSKHGIAVLQSPRVVTAERGVSVIVETRFVHKSGQWASTELAAVVNDAKPQTLGSAITYLRRYGLAAMAGVAPEDDDGNAANGKGQDTKPATGSQRRETPRDDKPEKPEKSPAERVRAGVKKLERLAGELGGDYPAKLSEELDRIGLAVVEPEKAARDSLKAAFDSIVSLVKAYQAESDARAQAAA